MKNLLDESTYSGMIWKLPDAPLKPSTDWAWNIDLSFLLKVVTHDLDKPNQTDTLWRWWTVVQSTNLNNDNSEIIFSVSEGRAEAASILQYHRRKTRCVTTTNHTGTESSIRYLLGWELYSDLKEKKTKKTAYLLFILEQKCVFFWNLPVLFYTHPPFMWTGTAVLPLGPSDGHSWELSDAIDWSELIWKIGFQYFQPGSIRPVVPLLDPESLRLTPEGVFKGGARLTLLSPHSQLGRWSVYDSARVSATPCSPSRLISKWSRWPTRMSCSLGKDARASLSEKPRFLSELSVMSWPCTPTKHELGQTESRTENRVIVPVLFIKAVPALSPEGTAHWAKGEKHQTNRSSASHGRTSSLSLWLIGTH